MRGVKILERTLITIPIMLGVAIVVFLFMRLSPGDPVDIMMGQGGTVSAGEMERLREEFNLDKPLHTQLWLFLKDIVRGDFSFENADLDDFVLIKSDGRPTYNYAVVVDDAHMRISHVIRGDDHISNTPRQVHLYQALGHRPPKFAHLPMILGADRARLSKRHGATSIDAYRDSHYLSEAMVNYLALLGWSFDGTRELFSLRALIDAFSLKRVSSNPAVFDMGKMEWINAEHFKMLPPAEKLALVRDVLVEEGLLPSAFEVDLSRPVELKLVAGKEPLRSGEPDDGEAAFARELPRLALIIDVLGNRLKLLRDVRDLMAYFYTDDFRRDETAVQNHLASKEAGSRLAALAVADAMR